MEKSQKTTRNMIEEKTNKLELIKKINSKKIEENSSQKEKIKINNDILNDEKNKINNLKNKINENKKQKIKKIKN